MNIDLTHLNLTQIIVSLFALTFLDWLCGVGAAVKNGLFTWDRVAEFLTTHVLGRVIPLSFAAAIGTGFGDILPAIPAVWAIFLLGAAAYLAETLVSIAKNLGADSAALNIPTSGAVDSPADPVDPNGYSLDSPTITKPWNIKGWNKPKGYSLDSPTLPTKPGADPTNPPKANPVLPDQASDQAHDVTP